VEKVDSEKKWMVDREVGTGWRLQTATNKGTIVPTMSTAREQYRPFVLFGKSRQTVLSLLYVNPDDAYYLRQISRITGIGMGGLQRELKLLAEGGIVSRVVRGHQVFYQADKTSPIFQELKDIIVKTIGLSDLLRAALMPLSDRINIALLYGSFAAGKENRGSDIDILVVGDVAFQEVVSAFADIQNRTGREINPVVYPVDEFSDKLVNGHHFITAVMSEPVIFLIGDKDELERLAR
jgi:uncharacterized protein